MTFPGCPSVSPFMLAFQSASNLIAIVAYLSIVGLSVGIMVLVGMLASIVKDVIGGKSNDDR
jgi:hypothetical protein